jgi:hypothetical protein
MNQLLLFELEKPRDAFEEIDHLKEEMSRLRKSLYAAQSELRKHYQEIAHEHQIIKLNLCKGKLIL